MRTIMDILDLLRDALEAEERRIRAGRLPAMVAEFTRWPAALAGPEAASCRYTSDAEWSGDKGCEAAELDPAELEGWLVNYLLATSGEPAESVWEFLNQDSLVLLPQVLGAEDLDVLERVPVLASRLLGDQAQSWSPGTIGPGATLVSPTHPEIVTQRAALLENERVQIDPSRFPLETWVLLAVSQGESPSVTPHENLLALYRSGNGKAGKPTAGQSLFDRLKGGDLLGAWDAARASERWKMAKPCLAYMLLCQALGLASNALREWTAVFGPFSHDSFLSRYETTPFWIDGVRLALLDEEILRRNDSGRPARDQDRPGAGADRLNHEG